MKTKHNCLLCHSNWSFALFERRKKEMVRWREEFKISPAIGNDCGVFVSKTEFEYGDVDCLGYIPIQTLLDIEHGHTDMGECDAENFFLPEYHYFWREI